MNGHVTHDMNGQIVRCHVLSDKTHYLNHRRQQVNARGVRLHGSINEACEASAIMSKRFKRSTTVRHTRDPQTDEQTQTDEADLMPYPLLDAIERSAIRDKRSPVEVRVEIGERFSQYSGEQLDVWVRRFFQLWSRNQWKRERYAPSFHLDDENLDPKTWCRFPILSGAFKAELEELG